MDGVVRRRAAGESSPAPPDYVPLDAIWQKFGYTRHPELVTQYEWQDLDEAASSAKDMLFWLKAL